MMYVSALSNFSLTDDVNVNVLSPGVPNDDTVLACGDEINSAGSWGFVTFILFVESWNRGRRIVESWVRGKSRKIVLKSKRK